MLCCFRGGCNSKQTLVYPSKAKAKQKKQHKENDANLKVKLKQHKANLKNLAKEVKKAEKQAAAIEEEVAELAAARKAAILEARAQREFDRKQKEEEELVEKKVRSQVGMHNAGWFE